MKTFIAIAIWAVVIVVSTIWVRKQKPRDGGGDAISGSGSGWHWGSSDGCDSGGDFGGDCD